MSNESIIHMLRRLQAVCDEADRQSEAVSGSIYQERDEAAGAALSDLLALVDGQPTLDHETFVVALIDRYGLSGRQAREVEFLAKAAFGKNTAQQEALARLTRRA